MSTASFFTCVIALDPSKATAVAVVVVVVVVVEVVVVVVEAVVAGLEAGAEELEDSPAAVGWVEVVDVEVIGAATVIVVVT